MIKKFFNLLVAIILFPACLAVTINIYNQLAGIKNFNRSQVYFLWGLVSYLVFHIIFYRPDRFYILGHETMHAVAAIFSGGKVKSIKVSKTGGQTTTNKTNLFINLAPYFFPVYTVILAIFYFLAGFIFDVTRFTSLFMFLVGFTLCFHVVLTVDFLKVKQPDLVRSGYIFSLFLIYIVNLCVLTYILGLIFSEVSFAEFLKGSLTTTKGIYASIYRQLFL